MSLVDSPGSKIKSSFISSEPICIASGNTADAYRKRNPSAAYDKGIPYTLGCKRGGALFVLGSDTNSDELAPTHREQSDEDDGNVAAYSDSTAICNAELQEAPTFIDATDTANDWHETQLVDKCRILAVGGRGGDGCVSFRREKHVPLGGADGGNGGPGGSVYLICNEAMSNLNPVKQFYIYKAESGHHGLGGRRNGAKGNHRFIPVPPGTHVYSTSGELYAVLQNKDDKLMIVRGGRGGKGNRYYMSKFNPAPYVCERGEEGVTREIVLNYKIIGHVALIGKPNSGKSSLLRCLSNARPRVADYAFSTKFPIMGMLDVDEFVDRSAGMDNVIDGDEPGIVDRVDDAAVVDTTNSEEIEYATTDSTYSDVINDIDGVTADNDTIGDISSDNYVMGEETDTRSDDAYAVDDKRSNTQSSAMMCMYGYRCSPQLQSSTDDAHDDTQRHVAGSSTADRVHSSEDGGTVLRGVHVKRVSPQSMAGNPSDSASDTYYGYSSSYESAYDSEDSYSTMYSDGSHDDHDSEDDDDRECTNGSFDTGANIAEMCGLATGDDASSKRRQLTIADVPGLIEGASAGRGLGHQFLKHIENSNVLAYVVDGSLEDPLADYHDVRNEVGLYNEALLSRMELVLINKIDLIDDSRVSELVDQFKQECNHDRVYAISAKTRQNMDEIKKTFANIYQEHTDNSNKNHEPMDAAIDDPNDFRKLNPRKFKVEQVAEGEFRIRSDYLERKIPMMRFEYRETLDKLRRILRTNRIHYKLRRMGVKAGDTVHVGGMSFCVDELAY